MFGIFLVSPLLVAVSQQLFYSLIERKRYQELSAKNELISKTYMVYIWYNTLFLQSKKQFLRKEVIANSAFIWNVFILKIYIFQ
jgi:hypothetical protein